MFTKEELLEKGVSEDVADEIIAGLSDTEDDSLSALSKALGDSDEQSLFKAGKGKDKDHDDEQGDVPGEQDTDPDEYDEKYMKKYMKRYMKSNGESCKKMMKEMGMMKAEMNESIRQFSADEDGSVIEVAEFSPILEKAVCAIESLSKALESTNERLDVIEKNSEQAYDLSAKSARVMLEMGKAREEDLSTSTGRKGKSVQEMTKAREFSKQESDYVYESLLKAAKNGNDNASQVLCSFESHGKDLSKLNKAQRQVVSSILNSSEDK